MTLRVALLCPYSLDHPGGVASHVLGLAAWLGARGHSIDVIAPGVPEGRERLGEGVTVHRLGAAVGLRFNGSTARLALHPAQARRARAIAAGADVVHVHEPLTPGLAYSVARASRHLVVTHHAAFAPGPVLGWLLRRRAARLPRRTTLAVSDAAAATARAVTGASPQLVPNGIDRPSPPPERTGWRGGGRPRVGFLGRRDDPRKGLAVFVELAELARRAGLVASFEVAGPGTTPAPGVQLVGRLDDADRLAWLRTVDVLVASNLGGESFGLVLVEALAAGCDVVASDLPAFATVLERSGAGRVFATGHPGAGLAALQAALDHPLDPRAAHLASAPWGWDRVGPAVLAALEQSARPPVASSD